MQKTAKILILSLTVALVLSFSFTFFEPQILEAAAVTDPILVNQTVTSEITIDSPSDVSMSASIPGITGGSATGSATWTVKSSNNAGHKVELEASASPAMAGIAEGDSFADYTEASANVPDYAWSVAESDAEFGYTILPETAADADQSFKDGLGACNVATNNPTGANCWIGFAGAATKEQIVSRSTETDSTGETIQVNFKTELNGPATDADGYLIEDTYRATVTATATEL